MTTSISKSKFTGDFYAYLKYPTSRVEGTLEQVQAAIASHVEVKPEVNNEFWTDEIEREEAEFRLLAD